MLDRRLKLLVDALTAIDATRSFATDKSLADDEGDLLLRSAVERQLEILGEPCARLVKEHPALFTEIPTMRLAVGLRNRIIHGYDAVDDETVYRTVQDDLPGLQSALQSWLRQLEQAV